MGNIKQGGKAVPNPSGAPLSERSVVEPSGIVLVHKDYWWWCVDGDPKRALFYGATRRHIGFAQCNSCESIVIALGKRMEYDQVAKLVKIPLAFVPWKT